MYAKRLSECSIEELAGHQASLKRESPGIRFAKKTEHSAKDFARNQVLRLFTQRIWPKGLSILTMPGLDWHFEKQLLALREGKWFRKQGPHRTYISGIESDRAIYHAALTQMPGLNQENSHMVILPGRTFAEKVVRNRWIARYYFGALDALMQETDYTYDAAWVDYTGPISAKRLQLIANFFRDHLRRVIVITAMRGRWDSDTAAQVKASGGYLTWLQRALPGVVLHQFDYADGAAPMSQIAIAKVG